MANSAEGSYDRGKVDGEIAARLAGHDRHFATINGSIANVANELKTLNLAVQRLGDQAVARDKTTVSTAAALKEADDVRRAQAETSRVQGESRWSPFVKAFAILAAIGTAIGIYVVLKS